MESESATNADELRAAIKRAHACEKPFLIHAKVLKEENVLPMVAPGTSLSDTIYYPAKPEKKKVVTKNI
jgi:acetolactate synthase I/II/III large subunit